jgi:alpha-tubulin suppressor-like RCC1 family protein
MKSIVPPCRATALSTVLVLVLVACGGDAPTETAPPMAVQWLEIGDTVAPGLVVGETLRLTATAYAHNRIAVPDAEIDWRSTDPAVAIIDGEGAVRAVSAGRVRFVASAGDREEESREFRVMDETGPWRQIAIGATHACGLTHDGEAFCWGRLVPGGASEPRLVDGAPRFASIAVSASLWPFACALTPDGEAYCWGWTPPAIWRGAPHRVPGDLRFSSLATGARFACGLTADGIAYCWGMNNAGQLGDGTMTDREMPEPVDTDVRFASIAAGGDHVCALTDEGEAHCWGQNNSAQLGIADRPDPGVVTRPRRVLTDERFATIGPGSTPVTHPTAYNSTCGLALDGRLLCWGYGIQNRHQTSPTGGPWAFPTEVPGGQRFARLAGGTDAQHYALDHDGRLFCTAYMETPDHVVESLRLEGVDMDAGIQCGWTAAGAAYCWGRNDHGQLGFGLTGDTHVQAVRVLDP